MIQTSVSSRGSSEVERPHRDISEGKGQYYFFVFLANSIVIYVHNEMNAVRDPLYVQFLHERPDPAISARKLTHPRDFTADIKCVFRTNPAFREPFRPGKYFFEFRISPLNNRILEEFGMNYLTE